MQRDNLADLTVFAAIAQHLSFKVAASQFGVTPSALSHSMRLLEERLGMRLLNRTTRSVALTDAGQRLLDRLRPAMDQIADALEDLNQERSRPFGRLRIHATHLAAVAVVTPIWHRFLAAYPEVQLELNVSEAPIDIVAQGFDAGIAPLNGVATDMIAVRVSGPLKIAVVGAPFYFAKRHPPRTPDNLASHHCIQYRRQGDGPLLEWSFERAGKSRKVAVDGRITVNDIRLASRAAVDGLGIAYLLAAQAQPYLRSGQLVRVLEDWSPAFEGLVVYYPGHRQVPAALRALIDMIRAACDLNTTGSTIENPFAVD
ncbi:LysR family transcriptional regulator [Caulobacter sp. S45]|uniref:LysR family transcriptional regulator n=1 Tax=Caulobacter sp. S45 TaxID=1641861 RepID=UPI00131C37B4|nr:LysR family transcriptional regulator [Caulobacter sp. S45]